ncbi:leucine rich repeat containing protein [Anaeramoeba flamelloides]|uniref:Leucine rich repeat containing protein n=1 Tax=Anaeramoeba flamelloides TaxID=1746091 RepID=A0AAV7ZWR6_9EUKA|nr:leucine rich repeat containing protein [Anaeramoeba flamelloides]
MNKRATPFEITFKPLTKTKPKKKLNKDQALGQINKLWDKVAKNERCSIKDLLYNLLFVVRYDHKTQKPNNLKRYCGHKYQTLFSKYEKTRVNLYQQNKMQTDPRIIPNIIQILSQIENEGEQEELLECLSEDLGLFTLPNELLIEIFKYFTDQELIEFSVVSKLFYQICFDSCLWNKVNFPNVSNIWWKNNQFLRISPTVSSIVLPNLPKSKGSVITKLIETCPNIRHLFLPVKDFSILCRIKKAQLLTTLSVCGNFQSIPENVYLLSSLKILDLSCVGFRCGSFDPKCAASMTNLKELYLPMNEHLNKSVNVFSSLTSLTTLDTYNHSPNANKLKSLRSIIIHTRALLNEQTKDSFSKFNFSIHEFNHYFPQYQKLFFLKKYQTNHNRNSNSNTGNNTNSNSNNNNNNINFDLNEEEKNTINLDCSLLNNLESLQILDVSGGYVSNIFSTFHYLKNSLKTIKLRNFELECFPEQLSRLTKLTYLDLSDNYIDQIPMEIKHLKSLTYLNLSGNDISRLPIEITLLKSLQILNLGGNHVQLLPKNFEKLSKLKVLDLRRSAKSKAYNRISNGIRLLPPLMVKNLKLLQYLNIENNSLSNFPKLKNNILPLIRIIKVNKNTQLSGTIKLINLNHLNLIEFSTTNVNKLKIINCPHLAIIKASNSPIKSLILKNTKGLEQLHLENTLIKNLDNCDFHFMNSLFSVKISGKGTITKIPKSLITNKKFFQKIMIVDHLIADISPITNLKNLKEAVFNNNKITKIPKFKKNNQLSKLFLNYNLITNVENIQNLNLLEQLHLKNNKITNLPSNMYYLKNIKILNLSENYIEEIKDEILDWLNSYKSPLLIDFSQNKLKKIPKDFKNFKYGTFIKFTGNEYLTFIKNETHRSFNQND